MAESMRPEAASLRAVKGEGSRIADSPKLQLLARVGYATRGVVYLIIAILAAKVAIGDGGTTTDSHGALRAIYEQPFGRALLALVTIGLVGYALWSFTQAVLDPERQGTDAKGLAARVGYGAVGVAYASLALAAAQLVMGTGNGGTSSGTSTRDWTARLLNLPFGPALVVLAGLVILGVAGYLGYRAYTADFQKRLNLETVGREARPGIIALGRVGYAALGVVLAIMGVFVIIAAVRHQPGAAKGLGDALGELAVQPYGHVLLGMVAIGLAAYGLYSFVEARFRRLGPT